jgi:UDP-N-acetylmuramyl tripeptide synthase
MRIPLGEIPLALGGAARHNVENALAAALAADALGFAPEAIRAGLAAVRPDPRDNPGRSNWFGWRGARILVDYAHNPDGFARLGELADAIAPGRRLLLFGQAGDRTEQALDDLAAAAAALRCARYVLKPLPGYARGRPPDEVVDTLRRGLLAHGVDPERIAVAADEIDGVRRLLSAIEPGDLALMLVHEDLEAALAVLEEAGATA